MATGTKYPEIFAGLAARFPEMDVKVLSKGGKKMPYITARTAMNRMDDVLGPENWWDEYFPSENSVLTKLTIRLPDGTTVTKQDAGAYAGMADSGDDDKSGFSDGFKRAAAKFGVARYLYNDGVPDFVTVEEQRQAAEDAMATLKSFVSDYNARWAAKCATDGFPEPKKPAYSIEAIAKFAADLAHAEQLVENPIPDASIPDALGDVSGRDPAFLARAASKHFTQVAKTLVSAATEAKKKADAKKADAAKPEEAKLEPATA